MLEKACLIIIKRNIPFKFL